MKKAKIFLIALTMTVAVGGALAFKTKTLHWFAFCDRISLVCTLQSFKALQTTEEGNVAVNYDVYGKPCIVENGTLTCTTLVTTSP